jgi:hypothetical protein
MSRPTSIAGTPISPVGNGKSSRAGDARHASRIDLELHRRPHQARQPLLNSECGNVWGYEGSTGDVDWSWDYHIMMNEFRRHPKVCGWLYTEHHDVINEWNGYYRFDRSEKFTGLEELAPGMTLADLHSPSMSRPAASSVATSNRAKPSDVPLFLSCLTDRAPGRQLILRTELVGWDALGRFETFTGTAGTWPSSHPGWRAN